MSGRSLCRASIVLALVAAALAAPEARAAGLAGSYAARALSMGNERLLYNLYLDAARTIVWGDGTGGSQAGPGVTTHGAGGTTTAYVFGRIKAGQDVAVGVYADTIRVTFQL